MQVGDQAAELTLPTWHLARALRVQQRVVRRLVALDVEADEPPPRPARPLGEQRPPPGEVSLAEIDEPCETEFQRRALAADVQGMRRGYEVGVWQDETGLDAGEIQGPRAHGPHGAGAPDLHQRVPDGLGVRRAHPKLVAEIAREAGARDHHLDAGRSAVARGHRQASVLEGLEALDAGEPGRLQQRARGRPLHGERRHLLGHLADLDVESERRGGKPVQLPLAGADAVLAPAQAEHRAVVDQVSLIVAPESVSDAPGCHLGDVARHETIEVAQRIAPGDPVFHHRREVVQ